MTDLEYDALAAMVRNLPMTEILESLENICDQARESAKADFDSDTETAMELAGDKFSAMRIELIEAGVK